jgi:hypothetical protein
MLSAAMTKPELVDLARRLHATHGLLPVPVTGKLPIGGTGWNMMPLEARIRSINTSECTGVGIQCGLVFHPTLGPVEARGLDCDIDDREKSMLFNSTLQNFFTCDQWRWGRRPATIVFTQPGIIKQEKFGPVQLLGAGKQLVWDGVYQNRTPLQSDPPAYWHEGPSIFSKMPPVVTAVTLQTALEAGLAAAGIPIVQKSMLISAPLSAEDLAMLTPANLSEFLGAVKSMLFDVDQSPTGSGRGTKLHHLGLKYGALIKASGCAPALTDAAREVTRDMIEFDTVQTYSPILNEIGGAAENAFAMLPGTLGQGDRRDFARGVGASGGHGQRIAVERAKNPLLMPTGREHPAQTSKDLMQKNLPPLRFIVDRFLTDSGCIVFAGKPKIGKGWIMLELAMSIAEGGTFWGERCMRNEVLMYMLEDNERRIKERITILRPGGLDVDNRLRFRYSVDGPFYVNSDGTGTLLDDIRKHMQSFPFIKFIVVDVLQRVRGTQERTDNAYQVDYKVIGAIQKLASELDILIIVVHHVKKGKVDDAIDAINGSFGVIGAADGGIIIGKDGDVVKVESRMRDIADFEFDLIKENGSPMWKPAQTVRELFGPSDGTKTQSVLLALNAAKCCLTAGDVAKRTGLTEKNVSTYLSRLMTAGQITRPSRGWYMANGLKQRERAKGIIDVLRRCPRIAATPEIRAQYAPNADIPVEATYMVLTDVAIREIDAGFVNAKEALHSIKHRGIFVLNSDTLWLIGPEWDEPEQRPMQPNPFAIKMPWETQT